MKTDISHRYAWAAGFIDGDGCFCLFRSSPKARDGVRSVSISAGNNGIASLEELQSLFGGRVHLSHKTSAGNDHWQWHLSGAQNVREAIVQLLPYLIEKREIAEVVFAYAAMMKRRGKRAIDPEELEVRRDLIDQYEEIRS